MKYDLGSTGAHPPLAFEATTNGGTPSGAKILIQPTQITTSPMRLTMTETSGLTSLPPQTGTALFEVSQTQATLTIGGTYTGGGH